MTMISSLRFNRALSFHKKVFPRIASVALVAWSICSAQDIQAQGSLTPPGAPAATMKTLSQIDAHITQAQPRMPISGLPYLVSAGGSYYLTTNLSTNSGNGITINASNVSIDFNGFSLIGGSGTTSAIFVNGAHTNIVLRNGTIRNWNGFAFFAALARNCVLDQIQAIANDSGAEVGHDAIVRSSTFHRNNSAGLSTGVNALVSDCTSSGNTGTGFLIGTNSIVQRCMAISNSSDGFVIQADCQVLNNTSIGHRANALAGFTASGPGSRFENNHSARNYYGFNFGLGTITNNVVLRNTSVGNQTAYLNISFQNYGPVISTSGSITNLNPWANFAY